MTEHAKNSTSGLASKEAGAAGREIEITPQMIEAGKRELMRFNPDFDRPEACVQALFLAMAEASFASRE